MIAALLTNPDLSFSGMGMGFENRKIFGGLGSKLVTTESSSEATIRALKARI
jgi:hypothetical protein